MVGSRSSARFEALHKIEATAQLHSRREVFTIQRVRSPLLQLSPCVAILATTGLFTLAGISQAEASHVTRRQTASSAPKIGSITVTGEKRFSAEQVIAATGLKAGQVFNPKDLDAVAEKLGKSGAFPSVTYSYVPKGGAVSIEFKVEETTKFRDCVFDNFVWLSPEEIQAGLKKEVPLYIGVAPETGGLLDEIAAALEKISREKGFTAHVVQRIAAAKVGDPNWSHLFVAEGPNIEIASFRFTGAVAAKMDELEREAERFVRPDYSVFRCILFASNTILPIYRERGYLRATFATPKANVLSRSADSSEFRVEVVYAMSEGDAYKWAAPEWNGNQTQTTAALDAITGMKAGELANEKRIDEGWEAVQKEYSRNGYVEAHLAAEPVFDEQNLLVRYKVVATEGPQYHMGSFVISGVPPKIAERLEQRWKLKPGGVYDATYPMDFLKREVFPAVRGAGGRGARVESRIVPNRAEHVIDVAMKVE